MLELLLTPVTIKMAFFYVKRLLFSLSLLEPICKLFFIKQRRKL